MKLALQVVTSVLAAAFLALAAVAAWAWMSGLVTADKIEAARRAMVAAAATASQDAKPIAAHYVDEELKEKQRAVEDLNAQIETLAMKRNDLGAQISRMEAEAVQKGRELSDREARIAGEEKAYADAKAARDRIAKGAAFRRQVEMFESMRAADAAGYLYTYDNDQALDLLRAFDAAFRAKVLEEIGRLDRAPGASGRAPKAPALLKGLWPGETASAAPRGNER